MTGQNQTSTFVVDRPALARTFSDNQKVSLLLMFAREPRSVSEVAAATGQTIARTYYHVTTLLRQGLITVAREERRNGRPVKYYRAVAASFFLPSVIAERPSSEKMAAELRALLSANFYEPNVDGTLFTTDEKGNPETRTVSTRRQPRPSAEFWQTMRLTDDAAVALAEEIREVLDRYQSMSTDGVEYLVHAALSPRRSS